jgi:hypothetical protein
VGILDAPTRWGGIFGDIENQEDLVALLAGLGGTPGGLTIEDVAGLQGVLNLTELWLNKTNDRALGTGDGSHIRYPTEQAVTYHVRDALANRPALGQNGKFAAQYLPDSPMFNVKEFGAKGDGSADDTAAIEAAIAAMPTTVGPYGGASSVLYFPPGRYLTQGNHVIASDKRCRIEGSSEYGAYLMRKSGASGDLLTIRASHTSVENLTFDGNRNNVPANSDSLVLDAAYCALNRVSFYNAAGNSLTIGKTVGAICTRLNQLLLRSGLNYGIHVVSGFGSTDGMWSNIDVGTHGKSGIRVSASAQMMVNVHAWGCGLEDASDNHGIWLDSTANHLVGCESETNLGAGVRVNGSDNSLVGGWFWGNVNNGVYILNGSRIRVADSDLYRNGVFNTAGSTSPSAANIRNEGGIECQISGNNMWDDGLAINGGGYAGMQPPTYPYPGRTAIFTVSYHLAEINGADNTNVIGNTMVRSRTRTGTSYFRTSDAGKLTRWTGNHGVYPTLPTISSSSVILVPGATDIAFISGTTTIDSILGGWTGRTITLRWTAAGGTMNAANFALSAAFTASVGSILVLQYDGTTWYEITRSKASQRFTNDVRMDVAPRFTGVPFAANVTPSVTGSPLYISTHTTGDVTFTLPSTANQEPGIVFEVVRGAAGGVTVLPPSGGTISGSSSGFVLASAFSSARFVSGTVAGQWIRTAGV